MSNYYSFSCGKLQSTNLNEYLEKYTAGCDENKLSWKLENVIRSQKRLLDTIDEPIYKVGWNFVSLECSISELDPSRENPSGTTYFMINSITGIAYEVYTYLNGRDAMELEDELWEEDADIEVNLITHTVNVGGFRLTIVGMDELYNLYRRKIGLIGDDVKETIYTLESMLDSLSVMLM